MENRMTTMASKRPIIRILFTAIWIAVGAGTVLLLAAAIRKNDSKLCKKIQVKISGIENSLFADEKFIDEKDIISTIKNICGQNPVGKKTGSFDLQKIEKELEKNTWIKHAQLFFDNNDILKVNVQEREPVARVFTTSATSFYIDTALKMLPLSDKFSARLPLFTGFPSDKIVLSVADSNLLRDVKTLCIAIQKDSFALAMIDQINITPAGDFELIPKIGNQLIVFGNAGDIEDKLAKLKLFYKEVMVKAGWSIYSEINVQYKNQVVAKKRGAEDKTTDSVRTLQLIQQMATAAAKQAEDSVQTILPDNNNNTADSSMIQQSIQREENFETTNATTAQPLKPPTASTLANPATQTNILVKKPTTPPAVTKPAATVTKPVIKNTASVKKPTAANPIPVKKLNTVKPTSKKPKAVMPKNDY
jgi:cell division protein FtsQ